MNSGILINSEVLSQSYIPEKLLHRDEDIERIIKALSITNSFVYGASGIGKSLLIQKAIETFNSSKGKAIYIDCSLYQTTNAIFHEILASLGSIVVSKSNYELTKRLKAKLRHVDSRVAVCLDHFERLKEIETVDKILSLGLNLTVISDTKEFYRKLSPYAKASIANLMEINPYSKDQVLDIILERARESLEEYTYSEDTLKKIAELSGGNITLALNLLKSLALKAENEGKKSIDEVEFEYEVDCPEDKNLNVDQKVIMKVLREWKSLPAGRLYDFYCEESRYPKSRRAFRNYMQDLCSKGFVRNIGEKRGRLYELVEEAIK
jgi:cell division control protein 6